MKVVPGKTVGRAEMMEQAIKVLGGKRTNKELLVWLQNNTNIEWKSENVSFYRWYVKNGGREWFAKKNLEKKSNKVKKEVPVMVDQKNTKVVMGKSAMVQEAMNKLGKETATRIISDWVFSNYQVHLTQKQVSDAQRWLREKAQNGKGKVKAVTKKKTFMAKVASPVNNNPVFDQELIVNVARLCVKFGPDKVKKMVETIS